MNTTAPAWLDWIRPWYVGATLTHPIQGGVIEGHIYPDCERLLRTDTEPRQESGWLDPHSGHVCPPCAERHRNAARPPLHLTGPTDTANLTVEATR